MSLHTKDPIGASDRSFSYDFLSQLTQETGPSAHSYSYDSIYNRLKLDDASYEVNSLHSVLSDAKRTFTYDARGNRTKMTSDTSNVSYSYDALDRLIEVITPEAHYSYSYDPFNRRLSKNGDEFYLYLFDNEIGSVDANHTIKELRILGEGLGAEIGASIAMELDGKTYIPLHDRQGNIALLLDTNGNPVETYRYDAFGNELSTGTISPWRFSSKRIDPETGLVYFGRRYYDPTLGKWLTQDPLGLKAGPNLYAYVLNGPMTRFDLYGLREETEHELCDRVSTRNGNQITRGRSYWEFGLDGEIVSEIDLGDFVKSKFLKGSESAILGCNITFVNGILNLEIDASGHLEYMSNFLEGGNVNGLYNASHGGLMDLLEAYAQTKFGICSITSVMLKDNLLEYYQNNPKAVRMLISFSQGAAVVKGALKLVSKDVQQSIISLAFGPAAIIPSSLCKESFNYVSLHDPVPFLGDPSGLIANYDCVYYVTPHPQADLFDHYFQSPTYQEILQNRLNKYITKYEQRSGL